MTAPLFSPIARVTALLSLFVSSPAASAPLDYPPARRTGQVDTVHGVSVADPYRWMEVKSPELDRWIDAQERLYDEYLGRIPSVEATFRRVDEISRFDWHFGPAIKGNRLFLNRRPAGSSRVGFVRHTETGLETVVDPDRLDPDGDTSYGSYSASPRGNYVAFQAGEPASRWGTGHVLDVRTGRLLDDRVDGLGGTGFAWTADEKGFFYVRFGELDALENGAEPTPEVRHHRLGAAADDLIHSDPDALYGLRVTDDGRYLVLSIFEGTGRKNRVWIVDLERDGEVVRLVDDVEHAWSFEASQGGRLFFQTTLGAPRGRIVSLDLADGAAPREVVPETENAITAVSHIGNALVVRYSRDARPVARVHELDGSLRYEIEFPAIGGVGGFPDGPGSATTYYTLNGLYDPGTVYELELESGESRVLLRPELAFDPDDYAMEQVFYESFDGTRVPMFVAHRRDVSPGPDTPLYMYGYGHGGWTAFPWFQPHLVAWLDLGGVYALPGIRGGGEYGADWQEAGIRDRKMNTIHDYLAAAEWLVANGYTSAERLVANGGSASGPVAAAAILLRPELFGAAVVDYPFLDMLRYHQFTTFRGWIDGYGSIEVPREFEVLRGYSPVHNVDPEVSYVPVLVNVGEKDRTSVPMHAYKFVAALQAGTGREAPKLLRVARGAGHSFGVTARQRNETAAGIVSFLVDVLELEVPTGSRMPAPTGL